MRLSDLIRLYEQERNEWPASPNELVKFCHEKYEQGAIASNEFQRLYDQLHSKRTSPVYVIH
ncbi:YppF family protein [Salirhabdus salicampi]|uniref:YppF family protein n=1 Tax=Salirhabdus salicampi TaxID=476102 RepID=UPI0020C3CE60|nr:YppF family protein [Salirhabdus salicampi]MCP8615549.1 hypothetical protein [Salirhabdus salicampi]